jgi:uncharacterized protein (DUF58 family)
MNNLKLELNFPDAIGKLRGLINRFRLQRTVYKILLRGRGIAFDSYRDFEQDDDASMIDWKASLRANKLLAKKYLEEREREVYFLVDVSNSMLFGSRKRLKAELAAELTVSLANVITNSGDKIGLILYSDKIVKMVKAGMGGNALSSLMKELSDSSNYGGNSNLSEVLKKVSAIVTSPFSAFIFVSDFINLNEDIGKELKKISLRFETMAFMIRDRLDEELRIPYQIVVQNPNSKEQLLIDPSLDSFNFNQEVERKKEEIRKMFFTSRIDLLELNDEETFFLNLTSFLRKRASGAKV